MPVGLARLGCTPSGPHGVAEAPADTGTLTRPRNSTSVESLGLTVDVVCAFGFQKLVNM